MSNLIKSWWWENRREWPSLSDARKALEFIDEQLIELIIERREISWKIARLKKREGVPIYNASQEEKVLKRWVEKLKEYGISNELINEVIKILRLLIDISKKEQNRFFEKYPSNSIQSSDCIKLHKEERRDLSP